MKNNNLQNSVTSETFLHCYLKLGNKILSLVYTIEHLIFCSLLKKKQKKLNDMVMLF
jgi:hypothetical protein